MADMEAHGMVARGSRNGLSALTEDDVRAIRRRLAAGEMHRVIAKDFGVGRQTVTAIAARRSWAWLD